MTLCGNNHTDFEDCANASSGNISAFIFLAAHIVLGIGSSVYYTLGISYLDDNARKNKAPVLLGLRHPIILNFLV
jgi:Organic Anion Transporter Polypeptide (OATP) family